MADWILWTPDYAVRVEQIDEQHKELFRRFNDLLEAMWDGKGKEVVASSLQFLRNYTRYHFGAEESLMVQYGCPDYQAHKSLHDGFIRETEEFIAKCASQQVGTEVVVGVAASLGEREKDHVKRMDVLLGAYLASRL